MPDSQLTKEEIQQIHRLLECVKEERFYELLDVHPHAASDTIRNAYYGLSRNWHPDRFFRRDLGDQKSSIEVIFMGITKAYRTLSDDQKRLEYDRTHVITRNDTSQVSALRNQARYRKGARRRKRSTQRKQEVTPQAANSQISRRKAKLLAEVKKNIDSQRSRAEHFFEIGSSELESDRPMQAAASLHVACKLEPSNKEYREKYIIAKKQARSLKALEIFAAAENAEQYQNYHEALRQYRKAVEYEVEDARAYARLAYLLQKLDPDPRESMRLMQAAVKKAPENHEYRCILGEIYSKEGMLLNARREFNKALELQKNYQRAKDGLKNL